MPQGICVVQGLGFFKFLFVMNYANEKICSLRMLRGYKATLESLIQDTTSLVAGFISLERMESDLGLPLDTQRNAECLAMAQAICRLCGQQLTDTRYLQGMRLLEQRVNLDIDALQENAGILSDKRRICNE